VGSREWGTMHREPMRRGIPLCYAGRMGGRGAAARTFGFPRRSRPAKRILNCARANAVWLSKHENTMSYEVSSN